jgi:hypothetical protein
MSEVECDDVLAHEGLTEIAIHNHIGDQDRTVDWNTGATSYFSRCSFP